MRNLAELRRFSPIFEFPCARARQRLRGTASSHIIHNNWLGHFPQKPKAEKHHH